MMATMEELERALRNAHAAGDTQAARAFAQEIRTLRAKEARSEFQDLPWWAKAARAADDQVRTFANAFTLGQADRLAAAAGGTSLAEERMASEDAKARAGVASLPVEILGLLGPASAASRTAGTVLKSPGLPTTMLREGIAGGTVGATQALGYGEDAMEGGAVGAIGGAAGGAAGKYIGEGIDALATRLGNIMPGFLSSVRTPRMSVSEQQAGRDAAYKAVTDAGIAYEPGAVRGLLAESGRRLRRAGADPELHPKATRRYNRMRKRMGSRKNPTTLSEIDTQRQIISRDVRGGRGEDEMGRILRENIDEFIERTPPLNASSDKANELIRAAREENRRLAVRKTVERAAQKSADSAKGEGNVAPFRSILDRGAKGFSKEEEAMLRRIVRGEGAQESLLSGLQTFAGKVGTVGSGMAAGGLLFGPHGAALGGLGSLALPELAKSGVRRYTKARIDELLDLVGGGRFDEAVARQLLRERSGGVVGGLVEEDHRRRKRKARSKVRRFD